MRKFRLSITSHYCSVFDNKSGENTIEKILAWHIGQKKKNIGAESMEIVRKYKLDGIELVMSRNLDSISKIQKKTLKNLGLKLSAYINQLLQY